MSNNPHLPKSSDFPSGTEFVIKEFDVPLARVPGQGWFNWFGGAPRPYDASRLRVDNNWPAESFEEWVRVVEDSLPPAKRVVPTAEGGGVDFDALARASTGEDSMEANNNLFGQAFALREWHFIARGNFPDVRPYIASNSEVAGGRYMVRAFTDTDRLLRFARENNLTDDAGQEGALILSIPTEQVIPFLEQFIPQRVHGVWFNSDTGSDGFFVPLEQLRPIKAHLDGIGKGH